MRQDKLERILNAAIRRLSHFGLKKATLAEIAEDVGMTKQSLYYYFPDKPALISAVLKYTSDQYLQSLAKHFALAKDFEEILIQLVETRLCYYNRYYVLLEVLIDTDTPRTAEMLCLKEHLRKHEHDLLTSYYQDAVIQREVSQQDPSEIITLVQHIIDALFHSAHFGYKLPDEEEVKQVADKLKQIIHLLFRGIAA